MVIPLKTKTAADSETLERPEGSDGPDSRQGRRGSEEFWQANMEALSHYRPELYEQIRHEKHEDAGRLEDAGGWFNFVYPSGEPDQPPRRAVVGDTPWEDVAFHLDTVPPEAKGLVVFLGMGLGYGPLLIQRERSVIAQVVIVEPSPALFGAALHAVDLRPLIASEKVLFFVGELDLERFEGAVSRVASLEDTHILRHLPSFQWQPQLYGELNNSVYMLLNQLNASGSTTRKCGTTFVENRLANLTLVHHSHSLDILRDAFQGRPAVLVAAGPSLDRTIPVLREVADRCVLIAADSALAPLVQAGIMPDFVTSIDYLDLNFEKLAPFLGQEWPFALLALIKATPLVPKRFPVRNLFLGFPEDLPHNWVIDALGIKTLPPSASSVAHLSLGLALVMGCDPVVFVGQDLSYTVAGGDHADGTVLMRSGLPQDREIFHVEAVGGGKVPTDRQMLSLQKLFEDIISETPRTYLNATVAGVRLRGTVEMPLAEAASRYFPSELPVDALLEEIIAKSPPMAVDTFLRRSRKTLDALGLVQGQLAKAIRLGTEAAAGLAAHAKLHRVCGSFADLPAEMRKLLARFDQQNSEIDRAQAVWEQVLELTFGILGENDRCRERNDGIRREEGYLAWTAAEVERINTINGERKQALEFYRERLASLVTYLEEDVGGGKKRRQGALQRVRRHLQKGNYVLAGRELRAGQPMAGEEADWLLAEGEIKAGMLDFSGAWDAWQRAVNVAPEIVRRVEALRHRFVDEWLGFVKRYGNAGEGGDNYPHLLPLWLGRVADFFPEGEDLPTRLFPLWECHAERIGQWLAAGRFDLAQVVIDGWAVFADRLPDVRYRQSCSLAAQGRVEEALAILMELLARNDAESTWLAAAARLLLDAGRFGEGIERLQEAVERDPQAASLWAEIGERLFAGEDYEGAAMAFERCFLVLPDRYDVLRRLGDSLLANGARDAAVVAYEAVLAKFPDDETTCAQLAKVRAMLD